MGVPQPDPQPKVPVVRRFEYTLSFEQATRNETFIHCDVHVPWSPSVARRLRADWTVLKGLHGGPIRALHVPNDRKHLKFLNLFGFRRVASFIHHDGMPLDIYST